MQGAGSGLQRSVTSFRRQGSSGLVWNDKFLQQQQQGIFLQGNKPQDQEDKRKGRNILINHELNTNCKDQPAVIVTRSRSVGPTVIYHRTATAEVKASSPPRSPDPPSPKVSACGLLCGLFGKPDSTKRLTAG